MGRKGAAARSAGMTPQRREETPGRQQRSVGLSRVPTSTPNQGHLNSRAELWVCPVETPLKGSPILRCT